MHFEKTKFFRFLALPAVMFLVAIICAQGALTSKHPEMYVVGVIVFGVVGTLLLLCALWFMYRNGRLILKIMTMAERTYREQYVRGIPHNVMINKMPGFLDREHGGMFKLSVLSLDGKEYRTYLLSESSVTEYYGIPIDREEAHGILMGLHVALFAAAYGHKPKVKNPASS